MIDANSRKMLTRMTWIGAAIGLTGALVLLIAWGPKWAGGFLAGAAVSLSGLEWWKAIGRGLDGSGKTPMLGSTILLMLRLPVLAAIVYVIVNVSGIASGGVLAGLLVSPAGIILEVLYEAVSSKS